MTVRCRGQDAFCWYPEYSVSLHGKSSLCITKCVRTLDATCNILVENSVCEYINDEFNLKKIYVHELITTPDSHFLIGLLLTLETV